MAGGGGRRGGGQLCFDPFDFASVSAGRQISDSQHFRNDRSLSDEQLAAILGWVAAGAPKGDRKDMPPRRRWPDESRWAFAATYGPPDLIIKSEPYTMAAVAQDAWWRPVSETG